MTYVTDVGVGMSRSVMPGAASTGLLEGLRGLGPVDMAFAATVDARTSSFVLDRFDGARTSTLYGVRGAAGQGLGGRAIALRRPVFVADYVTARGISHQHDDAVTREGLRSIVAVPVLDGGRVGAIVYAGTHRPTGFGERVVDRVVSLVRERTAAPPVLGPDDLRDLRAELRAIADAVAEPDLRRRLGGVLDRLGGGGDLAGPPPASLTRRERDVLAQVALGLGNRDVGDRLGLTEQTVKSYLKSAMSKLDSHTRGQAVHRAREAGLLG